MSRKEVCSPAVLRNNRMASDSTQTNSIWQHEILNPNGRYFVLTILVGFGGVFLGMDRPCIAHAQSKGTKPWISTKLSIGNQTPNDRKTVPRRFASIGNPCRSTQGRIRNRAATIKAFNRGASVGTVHQPKFGYTQIALIDQIIRVIL